LSVDDLKKEIEYFKNESKKAFGSRDRAKIEARKLKEELEGIKTTQEKAPKVEDIQSLKEELSSLRSMEQERLDKLEADELKNLSEREREKRAFDKELEKFKEKTNLEIENIRKTALEKDKVIEQKDQKIAVLTKKSLEGSIAKLASEQGALNPTQIVRLLKDDFSFNETLNEFIYEKIEKGKIVDDLTVDERVTEFLQDPDNENLLKPKGSVAGVEVRQSTENKTPTSNKGKRHGYDPKDPKLLREADEAGLNVEFLIDTKIMRDKKLKLNDFAEKK